MTTPAGSAKIPEDGLSKIVFIGKDMDETVLWQELDGCTV